MVITVIILENLEYLFMICGNIMSYQQRNMLPSAPYKKILQVFIYLSLHGFITIVPIVLDKNKVGQC